MTAIFEIEERYDDKGQPIFMIQKDGADLTARWTRKDAENEIAHLDGSAKDGVPHAVKYARFRRDPAL